MKRVIILAALLLSSCAEPAETNTSTTSKSTTEETKAPATGAFYEVSSNRYIREWQHPGTGCWYLLGTGEAEGIVELNDANGQVCDPVATSVTR